jgi:predicted ferric reductase
LVISFTINNVDFNSVSDKIKNDIKERVAAGIAGGVNGVKESDCSIALSPGSINVKANVIGGKNLEDGMEPQMLKLQQSIAEQLSSIADLPTSGDISTTSFVWRVRPFVGQVVMSVDLCPPYKPECGNLLQPGASVGDSCDIPCTEWASALWCPTTDDHSGDAGTPWGWCAPSEATPPPTAACNVTLQEELNGPNTCAGLFGCMGGTNMYVGLGCHGVFVCQGETVTCNSNGAAASVCSCLPLATTTTAPVDNAGLESAFNAIISPQSYWTAIPIFIAILMFCFWSYMGAPRRRTDDAEANKARKKTTKVLQRSATRDIMNIKGVASQMSNVDLVNYIEGCEPRVKELMSTPYTLEGAHELVDNCASAYKLKFSDQGVGELAHAIVALSKATQIFNDRRPRGITRFRAVVQTVMRLGRGLSAMRSRSQLDSFEEMSNGEKYEDYEMPATPAAGFKGSKLRETFTEQNGRLPSERWGFMKSETWANVFAFCLIFVPIRILGVLYVLYLYYGKKSVVERHLLPFLLTARMEGLCLTLTTGMIIFLMCRGLLTRLRKNYFSDWTTIVAVFDKHVLIHRLLAASMVPEAIVHTIAHEFGLMKQLRDNPSFSSAIIHDAEKITNVYLTWPYLTGYVLWLILVCFCVLSIKRVRKPKFEVFHYAHLILTALWVTFFISHGACQWTGLGIPVALIFVLPFALWYGIERGMQIRYACNPDIHINDAGVYAKTMVLHINLRGTGFKYRTGMYSIIRVPEISKWQWHPFTIASSSDSQLRLIIALAGNWTKDLAKLIKAKHAEAESSGKPVSYPEINVRGGFGAPASGMKFTKHTVLVGGGVGATPFLSFLSSICTSDLLGAAAAQRTDYSHIESARFYWISRDPSDFMWANHYLRIIAASPELAERVSLRLVMTANPTTSKTEGASAAEVALFWHAARFALMCGAKELQGAIGVPTEFGRPDWVKELKDVSASLKSQMKSQALDTSATTLEPGKGPTKVGVFVCGAPALSKSIEAAAVKASDSETSFAMFVEEF